MKNKLSNPFVTGGYIGPAYFCDREKEADLLMKAIESKRNVTLISLRRMGKTGLLKHVKHLLEQKKKSPVVIYADLLPTMNGNDMLNTLSSALLREKQYEKNIFEKLLTLLASLRPKMSYDELTGQPSIELKVETPADIQFGFSHLLRFISDIKQDLVFMMDEFQQITRYPEKNMESMLRTVIQTYPGVPFIFSGSSKHMLEPMFNAAERPFYQSAELMYLEKIAAEDYRNFIMDKFGAAHKKISPEVILKIFRFTRLHTFYVQHICNLLFESDQQEIDNTLINEIFQRVMTSNEPLFANYRNLLPSHQYSLLQAIAVENGIDKPTSGAFIHQYRLTSASSVTTSLKALADKEMIVQSDNRWQVYDVFFSRWLEYHYGGR
jgi:AAA+ ATPase superfamily predicted ATPase